MPAELLALGEQQLHPEADSEDRRARGDFHDNRLRQAEFTQVVHGIREGSHAWEDQLVCRPDVIRVGGNAHFVATPAERVLDAPEIVQVIIDNGNHS